MTGTNHTLFVAPYDISANVTLTSVKQPPGFSACWPQTRRRVCGSHGNFPRPPVTNISQAILTGFTGRAKTFGFPLPAETLCRLWRISLRHL